MPRSNYSLDSGDYVPILVGAPRADPRRRSPDQGNNIFLNIPTARPRAVSTSGNAQPINLHISPSAYDDDRSRSRRRHGRRSSSTSSDRSRRSYHRSSRSYEYDNLPYDVRRDLDFAKEARAEERERSLERRRRYEKQKWEDDYEDRKKKEQRDKERIVLEAKEAEEKRKKEDEKLRQKILDEEEEKKKKKKKERELEDRLFEERVREKFKLAGMLQKLRQWMWTWLTGGLITGCSDAHIDEVLHRKKREHSSSDREWAIDLSRPTFIKVNRKYLSPTTLDHFRLPWEWDKVCRAHDSPYIKLYTDGF